MVELRVISFNIRCCDDPDGNSIEERFPRLAEIISKYDADIIGFQEYRPAWKKYIKKYRKKKYRMYKKYRAFSEREATPILWKKDKFTCIKKGRFWLSDTPHKCSKGWDEKYDCFRMCTYVILKDKLTGKEFAFMNTHFGFGESGQIKSSNLILEYSKKISDYPTFVAGDFNMTPQSGGYKAITSGLIDVNCMTSNDLGPTYHGYGKGKPSHIDYCFVDDKIIPKEQKIITETVDGKYPSDHYGLYINMEL